MRNFEPDDWTESVTNRRNSSKRQAGYRVTATGVLLVTNRATDVILNMGEKRRRKMKKSIHPSQVTGIKGTPLELCTFLEKILELPPTPNVSLTAIPTETNKKFPLKKTNTRQLTPPIRANFRIQLNGVLVKTE